MNRNPSNTLFPLWNDPTHQISKFIQDLEKRYGLSAKEDGTSKINISISYSSTSDQISISDSYSAVLTPRQEREVSELIEMFSKAVDTVFSKAQSGSMGTEE